MKDIKALAAHRLGRLSNYRDLSKSSIPPAQPLPGITLRSGEVCLGVYENKPGHIDESVVVTDLGLHVRFDQAWVTIDYKDIQSADGPKTKEEISGVVVHLVDGRSVAIPVRGAHAQFRDAFPFLRFLFGAMGE